MDRNANRGRNESDGLKEVPYPRYKWKRKVFSDCGNDVSDRPDRMVTASVSPVFLYGKLPASPAGHGGIGFMKEKKGRKETLER
jgi:hypothetical protein